MNISVSNNKSDGPITEWFTANREPAKAAGNDLTSEEFSELVANSIKVEIEEYEDEGAPPKRMREDEAFSEEVANSVKADAGEAAGNPILRLWMKKEEKGDEKPPFAVSEQAASSVKEEDRPVLRLWMRRQREKPAAVTPAEAKFSALVAGPDKKKEEEEEPPRFDPRRHTRRTAELAQEILGFRIRRSSRTATRTAVELVFGEDTVLFLAVEGDRVVEYFFRDEAPVAEAAAALRRLAREGGGRGLVAGVARFVALRDRRRALLGRLADRHAPLVAVEGRRLLEARDARRSYFRAEWRVVLRRRTGRFDNAFSFSVDEGCPALPVCSEEFAYLTNEAELDPEDLERRWDRILEEVREVSERGA